MTPTPKKKHTRRRSNLRKNAATERKALGSLGICPSCKALKEPHKACAKCGFYK